MFINLDEIANNNDFSKSEIEAIRKEEEQGGKCVHWYALFLKSHMSIGYFKKLASEQYGLTEKQIYDRVRRGRKIAADKGYSVGLLLTDPKFNGVRQ